ncbi:hypothetical protein BDB01DRAFT_731925 [Pilobolus umbonatus]|nr:hypothetical protein BDB01DRAFT_731925 [Pilobolus umbonatus]
MNHIDIDKSHSILSLIDQIYPPLLCTLCDTSFPSLAASQHHYHEQHKKRPRYVCIHAHCDHPFKSRGALRFHLSRSHLPPSPSVDKVKKPSLSTSAQSFLNSIFPPLECPCCHQVFNRKTNVIKHLSEVHPGKEPYRCIYPQCAHPRLYATREGLVYHILRVHDLLL